MTRKEFRWRELPGDIPLILKQTVKEWSEDRAATLAAALSYYATFSLVPLLILVISLVGLIWGKSSTTNQVLSVLGGFLGSNGQDFIKGVIQTASQPGNGLIGSVIGTISLVVSSLGVFGELQATMNLIWEIEPKPVSGFWNKVKDILFDRLVSFGVVISLGVLLVISMAASTGLSWFGSQFGYLLPMSNNLLQIGNTLVSYLLVVFLLMMVFKYLPDVEIDWKPLLIGTSITGLLFMVGKYAINLYIAQIHPGSRFGAAGTLVLVLLWVYYSAQILFFGAEFTQVASKLYGLRIQSDSSAMHTSEWQGSEIDRNTRSIPVPVKDLMEEKSERNVDEEDKKKRGETEAGERSDILNTRRRTWRQSLTFLAPILGGVILAVTKPIIQSVLNKK